MGQRESFVLLRVLRVKYFDMCEWEEPFSTIDFSFPLTVYVHPCNLHNVSNLQSWKKTVITHGNLISDTSQMKRGKNKHKPITGGKESHSLLGIRLNWKVTFTSLKYQHFDARHSVCSLSDSKCVFTYSDKLLNYTFFYRKASTSCNNIFSLDINWYH